MNEIAVLRDGVLVSVSPASELDPAEMARRMVGREVVLVANLKPARLRGVGVKAG